MGHADPFIAQRYSRLAQALPGSLLIGLTGRAGSGKDTVAELLAPTFRAGAFADALRREVCEAWRIDARQLTDRNTKEWPIDALSVGRCCDPFFIHRMVELGHAAEEPRSARWIMQRWGTDYRRAQQPGYWLAHAAVWVAEQQAGGHSRLVISDVRFEDEAALVRALGGKVLRVHRPECDAGMPDETAGHASEVEQHLIATDDVIVNDGSIEELRVEVLRVVTGLA